MMNGLPRFREGAHAGYAGADEQTLPFQFFSGEDGDTLGRPAPEDVSALTRCAWPLLQVVVYIQAGWSTETLPIFKTRLIDMIHQFGRQADLAACSPDAVSNVRYLLCTALDEAVMLTPWGNNTIWSDRTLLSWFYDQTWGGDRSFHIIEQALSTERRDVLEVSLEILLLGFQGRFRTERDGGSQVHLLVEKIFRVLYPPPPSKFGQFSPEPVIAPPRKRLIRYIPVWWCVLAGAAVLLIMIVCFGLRLNQLNMHLQQEFTEMESGIPNGDKK